MCNGDEITSTIEMGRLLGAEIISGASWDQFLFRDLETAEEFRNWCIRVGRPYQGIAWPSSNGEYRIRAR